MAVDLYGALKAQGYEDLPDQATFNKTMAASPEARKQLYGTLKNEGFSDLPEFSVFDSALAAKPTAPQGSSFEQTMRSMAESPFHQALLRHEAGIVKGWADVPKAIANFGVGAALKTGLITQEQANQYAAGLKDLEQKYSLAYHPSGLGETIGAAMVPVPGLGNAKAASKLVKFGEPVMQGALLGGGYSAATGDVTQPDFLSKVGTGAGVGAVVNPALQGTTTVLGKGLGQVYRWGRDRFTPNMATEYLNRLIEKNPELGAQTVADIRAGEVPTSTLYAHAQETLPGQYYPTEFLDKVRSKSQQMVDKLKSMASGITDLIKERKAETDPAYKTFNDTVVKSDSQLESILSRFKALGSKDPQLIAILEKRPFQKGIYKPEERIPSMVTDVSGRPLGETVIPEQFPKYTGASLDDVRKTMAFAANPNSQLQGVAPHMQKAIGGLREELTGWMENKFPEWAKTRGVFQDYSKQINQKEVFDHLHNTLKNALDSGLPVNGRAYMNAVGKDVLSAIKKSTGEYRYDSLEKLLTPDQMGVVNDIADQISKQAHLEQRAAVGAAAGVKSPIEELHGTGLLIRAVSVLEGALKNAGTKIDEKVKQKIAGEMLRDPVAAANSLEAAIGARLKQNQRRAFIHDATMATRSAASKVMSRDFYSQKSTEQKSNAANIEGLKTKYKLSKTPAPLPETPPAQPQEPIDDMAERYNLMFQ